VPRAFGEQAVSLTMPLKLGMIDSALRVSSFGDLLGTGFLASVPSETLPGVSWGYVITAHHVVAGQIEIDVHIPNPFTNGTLYEPVRVDSWRQPLRTVDLAIAPLPRDFPYRYQAFPVKDMIPTERVKTMTLGAHVYYLGIFEPLGRPVARSGTVAALDQTGIPHKPYDYPAHLVDCRSYRGFSGSPCLAEFSYAHLEGLPEMSLPSQLLDPEALGRANLDRNALKLGRIVHYEMLCGMLTRHYSDEVSAEKVVSRYGVGLMVRSHEIREALMTEEAREERRRWDEGSSTS
jgi:hypothetical protein